MDRFSYTAPDETAVHSRAAGCAGFAEDGASLSGQARVGDFVRLRRKPRATARDRPLTWAAEGELRNPQHVHPKSGCT
jgi:hypothetical protein